MMTEIPPNNLDQLIAWMRLFSENTAHKIQALENRLKELSHKVRRIENEQPK
jgi:hypothetical protein